MSGVHTLHQIVDGTKHRGKIEAYTYIDGSRYTTHSDYFCIEVFDPCPTTQILSQDINKVVILDLDDTETLNLDLYGFPWKDSIGQGADVYGNDNCGDQTYYI